MEIIDVFQLERKGINDPDAFIRTYIEINEKMWEEYSLGIISQTDLRYNRFRKTLLTFGVSSCELPVSIGNYYTKHCPQKTNLLPNSHETLAYLQERYSMHIITNGFKEVQHIKLQKSGLAPYFETVVTSEQAGAKKPSPFVFTYALSCANARPENAMMIGDDLETDIKGAIRCGLKGIHFCIDASKHQEGIHLSVSDLIELKRLL